MDFTFERDYEVLCEKDSRYAEDENIVMEYPAINGIYKLNILSTVQYKKDIQSKLSTIIILFNESKDFRYEILEIFEDFQEEEEQYEEQALVFHLPSRSVIIALHDRRNITTYENSVIHQGFEKNEKLKINLKFSWINMEESRKLNDMCLKMKNRIIDITDEFLFRPEGLESAKSFENIQQEIKNKYLK